MNVRRKVFMVVVGLAMAMQHSPAQRNLFPAVISDLRASFVGSHRHAVGETRSIPPSYIYNSVPVFEVAFEIEILDALFWEYMPLKVAGRLPEGKPFQRTVAESECDISNDGRILWFVLYIEVEKHGSGEFLLTTNNAAPQKFLQNYKIRTEQKDVYFEEISPQQLKNAPVLEWRNIH